MAYGKCIRNLISSTVPDGKTVTPTDDISIWLACGGRSESYTTLSQVLADVACLSALINDNNAVDYLVRSTTWASDVCGDLGAMTAIGGNNYASNTLLADSTWCSAICNSTYFESVLNVKVPVMTSNTTPSGECNATSEASATYAAWRAFDGNSTSMWSGGEHSSFYLRYTFTNPIKVYCAKHIWFYSTVPSISYKIQGLNSGVVEYESENKTSLVVSPNENTVYISNPSVCESWQIYVSSIAYGGYTDGGRINKLQFYGRADI